MRIGIIHGQLTTLGGAEKVALSLIKALKKRGHEINMYFTSTSSDKIIETILGDLLVDVRVHKAFQLKVSSFGIYKSLMNRVILTKVGSNDDVLVETGGALNPLWFTKKPYIAYCNGLDMLSSESIQKKYGGWLKLYWYPYSMLCNSARRRKNYPMIVSNSQYTQELVKSILGVDSQVIYPPVEINRFRSELTKREPKIVILGRFAAEKNYELAVEIAEIVGEVEFIFLGSMGDPAYYKKLERIVAEKRLSHRIKFVSNVPMHVLREILGEARIYLHCRYNEPFGITVVEAIASGCIPIVPDGSAHRETVPFKELRFANAEEASEKIKNAIEGRYDELLPKLQEHIIQFDEKAFQDKMIKLIESL